MTGQKNYNAVSEFVDRNVENGNGEKPAFIDPDRSLTFSQLQTSSCQMANMLADLGIRRETRIGLLMFDSVDFPVCYWGALRAGVVPVCLNTLLTTQQYGYVLSDSRVQALFVSKDLLELVEPLFDQLANLKHIIVVGGDGNHPYLSFEILKNSSKTTFETALTSADEVAFWLYSSGSTGDPKGVRHVHSSLAYVARHFGQGVLGIRPDDVVFSAAKLFFAYAQGGAMAIPMYVGATTILLPERPLPKTVMATMGRFQPSVFFGVPTLYATMLADPACKRENCSKRLRLCVSAGEALPADVGQNWQQKMGVEVVDGVGCTEMLNAFLSNRPGQVRYGTSGREFDGYQLKLVDEDGKPVPVGEIGELLVNGGSMADGYWNKREKTRKTFAGDWLYTGDKYYLDEDGYYHYCGRTDDMIKVGGRWVSPFEVEQALVSHDAVLEAAVVACKDEEGLVKTQAFVILNDGFGKDGLFEQLKEHVKSEIGAWKSPRWIEFVSDLPKTATGKIQRYRLRR